jgi:HlyD family secretion protein
VSQIRLNATMTQNVVTYTVVVTVDNHDGRLIPYLTANLEFEVAKKKDVLLVPAAALRWQPRPEQVHPDDREAAASLLGRDDRKSDSRGPGGPRPEGASGGAARPAGPPTGDAPRGGPPRKPAAGARQGAIWIADGDYVRPVAVKVGSTDGARTEVTGDNIGEGMSVVIGEAKKVVAAGDKTVNPFQPNFFGRRRGGG